MTENPPPPPDERPSPENEPAPPRRSVFPPPRPTSNEPIGCAGRVVLVALGLVSFVIAGGILVAIFATAHPAAGLGLAVAALVALFVIRKQAGPSPALGAVTIGVGIAVVVVGGCMLILMGATMDFK